MQDAPRKRSRHVVRVLGLQVGISVDVVVGVVVGEIEFLNARRAESVGVRKAEVQTLRQVEFGHQRRDRRRGVVIRIEEGTDPRTDARPLRGLILGREEPRRIGDFRIAAEPIARTLGPLVLHTGLQAQLRRHDPRRRDPGHQGFVKGQVLLGFAVGQPFFARGEVGRRGPRAALVILIGERGIERQPAADLPIGLQLVRIAFERKFLSRTSSGFLGFEGFSGPKISSSTKSRRYHTFRFRRDSPTVPFTSDWSLGCHRFSRPVISSVQPP